MNKDEILINDILEFWIKDADSDPVSAKQQSTIWFNASESLDQELRDRFGELLERGGAGELDHWRSTPQGSLALIILLDQFSRNIYRGTSEAFDFDAQALTICQSMQQSGQLDLLGPVGKVFALMPLQHAEDLAVQEASVEAFRQIAESAPAGYEQMTSGNHEYAKLHYDIIKQFGRFPHRNRIMGRQSTEAEQRWLADGAPTFGQS